MDHSFDVPDSTDWLDTPLSGLVRVESALRCQVCKDFYDNPVITSCCHTFCSLCIRRCLSVEGKCPTCRSSDQELKLRRNWAMQEVVDSFKLSRTGVLEFARRGAESGAEREADVGAEEPASKKRKVDNGDAAPEVDVGRRTRSQCKREEINGTQTETVVVEDSEGDGDGEYQPDDGLVACPVCGRRMKNETVYFHLDRCTGPDSKPLSPNPKGSLRIPSSQPTPASPKQPPKRLPTINYSLLKEQDLRRKLRDLGIPEWGAKPLLQKRHTEWLNLWNANCDSRNPKSKRELLRELEVWERTQGGQAFGGPSMVMRKDFDGSAWSSTHGDEYKLLIANARKKKEEAVGDATPEVIPAEKSLAAEETVNANDANLPQEHFEPQSQSQSQPLPQSEPEPQSQPVNNAEKLLDDGDQDMKSPALDSASKGSQDKPPEVDNPNVMVEDAVA